jgi:hypothetical protein
MTVRTQYGDPSAVVTLGAGGTDTLTVTRPRTTPVERNTIDHVVRPYRRQEFEGGLAVVQLNPAGAVAALSLRAVEILDWDGNVSRTVLSTATDAYLGNATVTTELLARLMIAEDEASIRLTVHDAGGGGIASIQAFARFDFGLHNANYGSNAGL